MILCIPYARILFTSSPLCLFVIVTIIIVTNERTFLYYTRVCN